MALPSNKFKLDLVYIYSITNINKKYTNPVIPKKNISFPLLIQANEFCKATLSLTANVYALTFIIIEYPYSKQGNILKI